MVVQMVSVCCISGSHALKRIFEMISFKNHKAKIHDIWYVASPSRSPPNLFNLWPRPGGHMFYMGLEGQEMRTLLV